MRKLLTIGLALIISNSIFAGGVETLDMDVLVEAFIEVESHGNDEAIGDDGRAVGCLQICPIMVREANRIMHTNYTYADRYDRQKSIEIFCIVMTHRRVRTVSDAVRVWNPRYRGRKYINTYRRIKNERQSDVRSR